MKRLEESDTTNNALVAVEVVRWHASGRRSSAVTVVFTYTRCRQARGVVIIPPTAFIDVSTERQLRVSPYVSTNRAARDCPIPGGNGVQRARANENTRSAAGCKEDIITWRAWSPQQAQHDNRFHHPGTQVQVGVVGVDMRAGARSNWQERRNE